MFSTMNSWISLRNVISTNFVYIYLNFSFIPGIFDDQVSNKESDDSYFTDFMDKSDNDIQEINLRSNANFFWRPTRNGPKTQFLARPTRFPGSKKVKDVFLMRPMRRDQGHIDRTLRSGPKSPFWVRPTRSIQK